MPVSGLHAHEVDALGVGTDADGGIIHFYGGGVSPWVAITDAPLGSLFFKTDGTRYLKTGAGDLQADWTEEVGGGAAACCPYEDPNFWMMRGA